MGGFIKWGYSRSSTSLDNFSFENPWWLGSAANMGLQSTLNENYKQQTWVILSRRFVSWRIQRKNKLIAGLSKVSYILLIGLRPYNLIKLLNAGKGSTNRHARHRHWWGPWGKPPKKMPKSMQPGLTGWWFGTFFMFHNIWDNPSHWLIFFRGVETTNQLLIRVYLLNMNASEFSMVSRRFSLAKTSVLKIGCWLIVALKIGI